MIKEVEMKAFIYVHSFEFRKSVHDVSIQISIARAEQPCFMPPSACESRGICDGYRIRNGLLEKTSGGK